MVDVCVVVDNMEDDFIDSVEEILWCVTNNVVIHSSDGESIFLIIFGKDGWVMCVAIPCIGAW